METSNHNPLFEELAALQKENRYLKEIKRLDNDLACLQTENRRLRQQLREDELAVLGRHPEIVTLVKNGRSPTIVARQLGISCDLVIQYLFRAVGQNLLSRSEIVFAIDADTAKLVDSAIDRYGLGNRDALEAVLRNEAAESKPEYIDEALLYFGIRDAVWADMYEWLRQLERYFHMIIKRVLEQVFGPRWWDELPASIRKQCRNKQEDDPERQDAPYCYTTFIDLHDIFKEHWNHLSKTLPGPVQANRKEFLASLQRLNSIRNRVMHPVRDCKPTRSDFDFIDSFVQAAFAKTLPKRESGE